jgi:hypothetical protein
MPPHRVRGSRVTRREPGDRKWGEAPNRHPAPLTGSPQVLSRLSGVRSLGRLLKLPNQNMHFPGSADLQGITTRLPTGF